MPQYKLSYIATEKVEYSIMIDAISIPEAFNKFQDPEYDRGHCEEECFLGMIDDESNVQIEGEWIDDPPSTYFPSTLPSLSLKRYDEPIKLKQ